ncbi:MAG: hypothetical protein WCJ95_18810 [Mariniphaga sp.]
MKFNFFKNTIYIIFFAICIMGPLIFGFFGFSGIKIEENRKLAQMPILPKNSSNVVAFPQEFNLYFNDNFLLRPELIVLNSYLRYNIFRESSTSKVILGRNGWFYFAGEDEGFRKRPKILSISQLKSLCFKVINRKLALKKRGIHYYAVIVPDKQSVYPEYLEEPQKSWVKYSKHDQFINFLNVIFQEEIFLNLKSTMLNQKNQGKKVYYKTDSHVNSFSSFAMYSKLLTAVKKDFPEIKQIESTDLDAYTQSYHGDLTRILMHLPINEPDTFYKYKNCFFATCATYKSSYNGYQLNYPLVISSNNAVKTGTVIVLRDSQFIHVVEWFAESFTKVLYINYWENNDIIENLILTEHPFIIIDERVERNLFSHEFKFTLAGW